MSSQIFLDKKTIKKIYKTKPGSSNFSGMFIATKE